MMLIDAAAIEAYRWATIRGALRLEQRGLKTRGGALRPRLAKQLGLTPRAPYEAFLAAVQVKIDEFYAKESEADH